MLHVFPPSKKTRARGRFTLYTLGFGLSFLSFLMLFFVVLALLFKEPISGFLITSILAMLLGFPILRAGNLSYSPSRRESLVSVLLLWFTIPLLGGIPYIVNGDMSVLNAFFESMSGFTTTGATVLVDFDSFNYSLFLWRALTQWMGGIGIIVLFIAVFPQLAIAGRQVFFAEAPGPTEERLTPRLRQTSNAVLIVYTGATVLCILSYLIAGMSVFDAVAHALTTVPAGGFSPHPLSFAGYAPRFSWICLFFLFFAGVNFALQYRVIQGYPRSLTNNPEFRFYSLIVVVASSILCLTLLPSYDFLEALRHSIFQVLTILTSAGYASIDYANWSPSSQAILVALMFIGGSAGSGAGGIKAIRVLMIAQNAQREVQRSMHPRMVLPLRIGNSIVSEEVMRSVAAFITLYIGLFAFTTILLVLLGSDLITSFTAAAASVGNIGPGLAGVGPMASFAEIHPVGRALLIFTMYAGRLEIITVFVIFNRGFWKLPKYR